MANLETKIFGVNKPTSHCKWAPGVAFHNINPLVVNNRIIDFAYNNTVLFKLGYHTAIYHCPLIIVVLINWVLYILVNI